MDIRVAAYGVIIRGSEVLLTHWSEGGRGGWTLPGGGIELGEHPADAAIREIREETGYEASLDRLLGIDSLVLPPEARINDSEPLHSLRVIYVASVTGGNLTNELDGSTDEARWIALDDLPADRVSLVDAGLRLWRDSPH